MEGFSALIMQLEAVSNCTVCKSAPTERVAYRPRIGIDGVGVRFVLLKLIIIFAIVEPINAFEICLN